MHWFEPLIAGVAVVLSSHLARAVGGKWGGIVAAAPITPTLAVLAMNRSPDALLQGLPVVAATVVLIALIAGKRPTIYAGLMLFSWTGLVLLAAWLVKTPNRGSSKGKGLAWPIRFLVGAGTVSLVAWSSHEVPILAPYLAMAPWLFVAGVTAATLDGGKRAGKEVMQGGATGAVGIVGFVWAAATASAYMANGLALLMGWLGFVIAAGAWTFMRQTKHDEPSCAS